MNNSTDNQSFKTATPTTHLFVYSETTGFGLEDKQTFSLGRLWRQYNGTSYDIEHNAKEFLKAARCKSTVDLHTLETAMFVKKTLTYVMHKRAHLPNSTLKALSNQIKKETLHIVHKLASLQKVSELRFCCTSNYNSLSIELLQRGAKISDAHGHHNELLAASYKKKNYALCLTFVKLGATCSFAVDELLEVAIATGDERAALLLITKGANLNWKNARASQSHLHLATEAGLINVVNELLKRGAKINTLDADQNSAFHIACCNLDYDIAALLLKHGADAAQKNSHKQSGLALTLGIKNNRLFLSKFFQAMDLKRDLTHCPQDSLEAAFLLQDLECGRKFAEKHSKKEFLSEVDRIKRKYKGTPSDFLTFCHYIPTQARIHDIPVPRPQSDVSLHQLLSFCQSTREQEKIAEFIRRIEAKIPFRGTPTEGSSNLAQFYQSIEHSIKNILISQMSAAQKRQLVQELVDAVDSCGGRYFTVVNGLYRSFCTPAPTSPQEEVLRSLGELREYILRALLGEDVSKYNYFVRIRGRELGIPGAEEMQKFLESFGHVNIPDVEKEFYKIYTPETIYEWIKPVLERLSIDAASPDAAMNYLSGIGIVHSVLK